MQGGISRRGRRALTVVRTEPSLADASRLLAAGADERAVVRTLIRIAVPGLADACVVDVVEGDHTVRRFGHARSARRARELSTRAPLDPDGPHLFSHVMRTGRADLSRRLMAVPLVARGHRLGVLTLLVGPPRRFSVTDVAAVQDLAARAALALDNVRLARASRDARDDALAMFATLSHELRNAMNAILGWAQVLRTLDAPTLLATRALEAIERNTRLQAQLIEDLFDVSRITSGKFAIELAALDFASIVAAAVEDSQPAAAGRGVQLSSSLATARVQGD